MFYMNIYTTISAKSSTWAREKGLVWKRKPLLQQNISGIVNIISWVENCSSCVCSAHSILVNILKSEPTLYLSITNVCPSDVPATLSKYKTRWLRGKNGGWGRKSDRGRSLQAKNKKLQTLYLQYSKLGFMEFYTRSVSLNISFPPHWSLSQRFVDFTIKNGLTDKRNTFSNMHIANITQTIRTKKR